METSMKRNRLITILLLTCILFSVSMTASCGQKKKFSAHSLDYFDTATTVVGYEHDKASFDEVSGEIISMLGEYHRLFTIYHRFEGMENLCTVNELKNGVHRKVTVDGRIIDMLSFAAEMYSKTDGMINVAMGSVLSIWHDYRTAGIDDPSTAELPPMDKLKEAALHTSIEDIVIDRENSTVWLSDPLMSLDVGAIAKGYAVEMVARAMEEKGVTGYVINVGGNVRTVGSKPDGEGWLTGIENPDTDSDEPYIEYLSLSGESIVTSGSYQRYYTVGDKSYHHIIAPATLMPAEGYLSVSVVSKSSAEGDALSTALFCMPLEDGKALVESLPDVEAMWVMSDSTSHRSSGFDGYVAKNK